MKRTTKRDLRARKRAKAAAPRRGARLGQHFLTARWAATTLVECMRLTSKDMVLEIGPGTGNLTKELLRTGATVVAIEKDTSLVETLRARFGNELASGTLTIVEDDIRNVSPEALNLAPGGYVLAANIPYYITGDIIRMFLSAKAHPSRMALLVQKEVAERIAREKKESILSLSVKAYGAPRYVATVSRSCFSPAPRVDSAILAVESIDASRINLVGEKRFFDVVKKGFASKRKMVGGNLKGVVSPEHMKACGITPQMRAENIPLEKWVCLSRENPV